MNGAEDGLFRVALLDQSIGAIVYRLVRNDFGKRGYPLSYPLTTFAVKTPPLFLAVCISLFSLTASHAAKPDQGKKAKKEINVQKAAARIDSLVEAGLKRNEVAPNAAIDDATFLRRAYLDIAGRIPTIEEAENFHGSTYPRKREQLISDLLESDGHVSHAYNFWADVLRINSGLGIGAPQAEAAYQLWVKKAIEENMPYDEFVEELVSAKGKIWENGAVGYYFRDRGMPLDNMSNTVRIFLGTRLECAQCHNHPFDKWTQMDYFKMAAFSYGVNSRGYDSQSRKTLSAYQRQQRQEIFDEMVGVKGFPMLSRASQVEDYMNNPKLDRYLDRYEMTKAEFRKTAEKSVKAYEEYMETYAGMRDAVNDLYNPLRYVSISEAERTLKLPHDYQYDDAKPHDPVTAATMFGEEIDLTNIDDTAVEAYAKWMTSKTNPTFTKVIANRLWKKVFGHGVFEPVDELTEQTVVANPELLAELEKLMRDLDYDMRKYQEILYNTKTYQRGANAGEMVLGAPYHFQGPVLRRMSAEQIWDSIVALALPEADSYRPRLKSQLGNVEKVRQIYAALEERSEEEYIDMVLEITKVYNEIKPASDKVRDEMYVAREAGDEERYRELRNDLNALRNKGRKAVSEIGYKNIGKKVDSENLLAAMGMTEMTMTSDGEMDMGDSTKPAVLTRLPKVEMPKYEYPEAPEGLDRNQMKAWKAKVANDAKRWKAAQTSEMRYYTSLVANMARASELESPARRGHFLREFGQSDREVIENAAYHASVPQALSLLNGTISEALTNKFAVFGKRIAEAGDPEEKTRMIFQAMLTREPTEREMEIALNEIETNIKETGGATAYEGLVWSLLNTQQFIFIQ